jgi:hypothetical protein
VVPVSNASTILLSDAEATLRKAVRSIHGTDSLDEAFVGWALHGIPEAPTLAVVVQASASKKGGLLDHSDVAILGFGLACGVLDPTQRAAFLNGLARLCGRNPVMHGTPIACCSDPIALLGLTVGATEASDTERDQLAKWVSQFFARTCGGSLPAEWQFALLHVVAHRLSLPASLPALSTFPADLRVVMRAKGLVASFTADTDEDEAAALQLMKSDLSPLEPTRAALRLAALRVISQTACVARLDRPTVEQLVALLRRVPNGLSQWTWEEKSRTGKGEARKWHIENEYHVQNLLWLLLSPLFPDIRPEEYTPPVGTYQPRVDLGLPSLRAIVEVKFWRASVKVEKMIEEIAADSSIYFVAGSAYSTLIPFIWDNARRTEEHEALVKGLKQLPHVADAVVIARPGLMEATTSTNTTS